MIQHHPDDSTLAAYAAGSLPAALALVVGCHLESCPRCREIVAKAEKLGGALINELPAQPMSADARRQILAQLDNEPATAPSEKAADSTSTSAAVNQSLPVKLQRVLGNRALNQHKWRSAGPGVKLLQLDCNEGKAVLLDIAPGHAVPEHSHGGNELTLILNGDYVDNLGRFASGDVADLDDRTLHQPKAGDEGCLCLAGLDAPMRYKGLLPRLMQPFFGL